MLLPVYFVALILMILLCIAIFPKWVLIGVPVLLVMGAWSDMAHRNDRL